MYRLAAISVIAVITVAGRLGFRSRIGGRLQPGRREDVGAAFGRPAVSVLRASRCLWPRATRSAPRRGAMERPCSALRRTCVDPLKNATSLRRRTGVRWISGMPILAELIRY